MLSKTKEIKERFKEFDKTENLITEYGVITENGDEGNGEIKLSEILDLCDHIDELERKLNKAIFIFERFIGDSASVQTNINRNGQAALKQIRGDCMNTMDAAIDELQELRAKLKDAERKLKIAEDALAKIRDKTEDNLIAAIADNVLNPKVVVLSDDDKALKQIRGEE